MKWYASSSEMLTAQIFLFAQFCLIILDVIAENQIGHLYKQNVIEINRIKLEVIVIIRDSE